MLKKILFAVRGLADLFDIGPLRHRPYNPKQYLINTNKYLERGFNFRNDSNSKTD